MTHGLRDDVMTRTHVAATLVAAVAVVVTTPGIARAAEADYHHVHITTSAPQEGVRWYTEHLDCQPVADRNDAADCDGVEVVFVPQATMGGTQGTGVNHIGFSYADLTAKMGELEAVGVRGSGVRLQRFEDGSSLRDIPGLFKIGFIFDPWGTRIELVEDEEFLGFHHIHLSATDPEATLAWYRDNVGGESASLRGRLDGLLFGDVWLLVSPHPEGMPATTEGRAIDHLGFVVSDLDSVAAEMRRNGLAFQQEPLVPVNGRTSAKQAFLVGPDNVRLEVVEAGFAGVAAETAPATVTADASEPYDAPRAPWGEPDLQGVWTGNSAHGIPLERPLDATEIEALTPEEAIARRERGTLGSIWGYEREWRDTTLGYVKTAPSTQVAMVIDPPDGRVPPMTAQGEERIRAWAARPGYTNSNVAGPEEITPYVRCITRGLPGLMMPSIYNNGLQIYQGPGYVAIQKEMIHETRIIPTEPRAKVGPGLKSWLGDTQGRWEGDTLVVETSNFNGRSSYRGSTEELTLTERFTRVGPAVLEYQFTVDDPSVWTRPWTGMFRFDLDDEQYELVEYACHEGNYGMTNILSAARARDREAAEAGR